MKPRNREVNIFNMSLLDILCGALGAFCFLMLALFPDHAKVKTLQAQLQQATQSSGSDGGNAQQQVREARQQAEQAQRRADKARAEQSLVYFQLAWFGPQDIDLLIQMPDGKYLTPKKNLVPPDKFAGDITDVKKGPAEEISWFSDVAYEGNVYRLFARFTADNGEREPPKVNGYITGRVPDGERSAMGLVDLGIVAMSRVGELRELGRVEFTRANGMRFFRGTQQQQPASPGPGGRLLPPMEPARMFTPPAGSGDGAR